MLRWKLDGDDVADESALIRTFFIIDGNSWNVDFFQVSTLPPPITHGPINCKNYGEWGDSVALEIGWLLFVKYLLY